MPPEIVAIVAGLIAGLVASLAMDLYQRAASPLFGQDQRGDDDPATVKAADSVEQTVAGKPVARNWRKQAGTTVHYAAGAALGIGYGLLVLSWPPAALAFGVAFGIVVMLVLDETLVPAFGWGSPPWSTPVSTHAYGLTSHIVFGMVLEGCRRLGTTLLT